MKGVLPSQVSGPLVLAFQTQDLAVRGMGGSFVGTQTQASSPRGQRAEASGKTRPELQL